MNKRTRNARDYYEFMQALQRIRPTKGDIRWQRAAKKVFLLATQYTMHTYSINILLTVQ